MNLENTNSGFPAAHVSPTAQVAPNVRIDPFAIIHDGVEIGPGTHIGSHVVLYPNVKIGADCRIMPGTVITADVNQLEYWRSPEPSNTLQPTVQLGDGVHIESNSTLHGGITIGAGTWIGSGVTIHDGARIGAHCRIFPGAVLSAIPQDLKFKGEKTTLEIGDHTTVREFATLNRGTSYHGKTQVGSHVLIMAYVHIAHDCMIGDHVILANAVNMAGHVQIGDYAIIGGVSAIHQFVKIGHHCMISGGSLVRKDVPPYVKAGRNPLQYEGVNSIGLRRRGFSNETIHQLQEIYRQLLLAGMNNSDAIAYIEAQLPATEERDEVITFVKNASRGIIRGQSGNTKSKGTGNKPS